MSLNDGYRSYSELLTKLLGFPADCMNSRRSIDWISLEADFGFILPQSFKMVSNHLPAGFLGSGMTWMSPATDNVDFRFDLPASERYHDLLKESGVLPLYPTLPGYLVFATTFLRIDLAFSVESIGSEAKCCHANVALIECISGEVEATNVEIDEFLYRAITNHPPLTGPLSAQFHEWFFTDTSFPLFRPINGH